MACIAPCHDFSSQNLEIRASVPDVERPDGVSTADDANGRQGRDHARGVQGWVARGIPFDGTPVRQASIPVRWERILRT